ncbi:aminopeptidase P family protein [Spiroplasma poulsonii]|uniref:Aminopeptidase P family protein n=1 Tax=Spiroplasma poulsonii TaxID=2138 RepID=A0A433ENV9_9MOLU|nr:aminopeptidase P family protein [Spiroplasma poulsonii]MBW3059078.1 aminopeptidase P family protein [Spiroplasma poulsonii]RUP76018.1 aminopeptidase P family protein [Spiroplasma poulsonii]
MKEYVKFKLNKQAQLEQYLKKHQVDGILFHSTVNRFWFSEFESSEGYLLFTKNELILYLDGRYITAGKKQAKNVTNVQEMTTNNAGGFFGMLQNDLTKNKVKVLAFESDYLTYLTYQNLAVSLATIELKPVDFSELRTIKSNQEINVLKQACAIGDIAINNVIKNIKPGMTERQVEQIIINSFIEEGADKPSFDTIVASGWRGALPHGRATDKVIENNELITIDFGCIYNGYCSDTTRTIGLGKPSPQMLEIFDVVYQAQKQGIEAIKPGVSTATIDKICRDYITSKGYGQYFTHLTGHGVGIEIHEFPRVSPFCNVPLEPGMIITVEPGIYIPDVGGVRIEDDILVTENGYELLTEAKRDLILI